MRPFGFARWLFSLATGAILGTTLLFGAETDSLIRLEDRLKAQRAIEQVRWDHRIWPEDNPSAKPALETVLPESALRAKVEDYLAKSNALNSLWQRPISGEQLEAELSRITRSSRAPDILRDLFTALGNDPRLIAETLARQSLADRLIRSWYARDPRFHGALRRRVEELVADASSATDLRSLEGVNYKEFDSEEDASESLARAQSGLVVAESDTAFYVTTVLRADPGQFRTAVASWPKVGFDEWWAGKRESMGTVMEPIDGALALPAITSTQPCDPDTWTRTLNAPNPRAYHAAVWTGSEMIIWGGKTYTVGEYFDTGGRYDPVTDTWVATSVTNAPLARSRHTAEYAVFLSGSRSRAERR